MSDLVPADEIERIVGAQRHPTDHFGRAVSSEQTVYILHSRECKDSGRDLRKCPFSIAQDRGIDNAFYPWSVWRDAQDRPVRLVLSRGYLMPDVGALSEDVSWHMERDVDQVDVGSPFPVGAPGPWRYYVDGTEVSRETWLRLTERADADE